jgi:hypothetical protein
MFKALIKPFIPKIVLKIRLYIRNFYLYYRVQIRHKYLEKKIKRKTKIRVVFLVIHKSIWKVDTVYKKMESDCIFDPVILICPDNTLDKNQRIKMLYECFYYFSERGYKTEISYQKEKKTWIKLVDLNPDIIFFTNPYNLTSKEYYKSAYLNYLSIYVPYYFMATRHAGGDHDQYSDIFFSLMWKLYWPHLSAFEANKKFSFNRGKNSYVIGYPASESILTKGVIKNNIWKGQAHNKKKIIYAPHHTIEDNNLSLSTFLSYGLLMKSLATKYSESVQWAFKPHPMLKQKLYKHPDWGTEKTNEYYAFWKNNSYTQIHEGGYDDLFLSSDSIIHDCSSFIVEYAFIRRPCLFLVKSNKFQNLLNSFGKEFIKIYDKAYNSNDIENFINSIIGNNIFFNEHKTSSYIDEYIYKHYETSTPSEIIIQQIKSSINHD